jgi:hypothetical protein
MSLKIDKPMYDWLCLATGNGNGFGGDSSPVRFIHVCDESMWSTDGVRLHCIGDPSKTFPVLASYLPTGYKKFNSKVKYKIECELFASLEKYSLVFDFDVHAEFEISVEMLRNIREIAKFAREIDFVISSGRVMAMCDLPVYGRVSAVIGDGAGDSRALINTRYLLDAASLSDASHIGAGVVSIGKFATNVQDYKPVKISSEYKGVQTTALVMPMLIKDDK